MTYYSCCGRTGRSHLWQLPARNVTAMHACAMLEVGSCDVAHGQAKRPLRGFTVTQQARVCVCVSACVDHLGMVVRPMMARDAVEETR
jgi:hypothetical protein